MYADNRFGGPTRWYIGGLPEDFYLRVPDQILKTVVYIGKAVQLEDGTEDMHLLGTGFIVFHPNEFGLEGHHAYLVTAKHVAVGIPSTNDLRLRVNRIDGQAEIFRVPKAFSWWDHPDDAFVDAVVTIIGMSESEFDFKGILTTMFATDAVIKERNIGPGDEVFIAGLFHHVKGKKRNLPIVRTGNVAMIPEDMVPTLLGDMDAYLIEARSIGGISGSPVFVHETVTIKMREDYAVKVAGKFHFFGVTHGHWNISPEALNEVLPEGADNKRGVNMGIAIVTPAKKILDILQRKELVEMRRKIAEDEKRKKTQLPVMDSVEPVTTREGFFGLLNRTATPPEQSGSRKDAGRSRGRSSGTGTRKGKAGDTSEK